MIVGDIEENYDFNDNGNDYVDEDGGDVGDDDDDDLIDGDDDDDDDDDGKEEIISVWPTGFSQLVLIASGVQLPL